MIRALGIGSAGSVALAVVLAAALTAAPAAGQTLEVGTWTGSIIGPDGDMFPVEFDVTSGSDGLQIVLQPPPEAGDAPPMPFEDIVLDGDVLQFAWLPGPRIQCMLELSNDGSFEGPCSDPEGDTGFMTMTPPKD